MSAGTAVASAGLLLFLPGLLSALAVGMRGHLAVAAAPALTLGSLALAAVLYAQLDVPWSVGTVVPVLLAVPVVLLVLRRPWRTRGDAEQDPAGGAVPSGAGHRRRRPSALDLTWLLAWAVVSGLAAYRIVRATLGLTQPQQYWDGMFHANSVRFIADSQVIDSAALAPMAQPENTDFLYPDVFHGLAALLVQTGRLDVPMAINAVLAVLPAVFAAGLGLLAWVVLRRPLAAVAAAVLGTAVTAFPYDLMFWGPLWPYGTAVAAVPGAVALVLLLLRHGSLATGSAAVLAMLGVVQTQPAAGASAVVAALLLGLPVLRDRWVELGEPRARLRAFGGLVAAGIALLVLCAPLAAGILGQSGGGVGTGVDWVATQTPGAAIGQLLTFNQEADRPQWWIAGLLLAGVVVLLRRRGPGRMLLAVAAVFLGQYVLASAYDNDLSLRLTSMWWNDKWRFAAIFVVPAVLIAAAGVQGLADGARRLSERAPLPATARSRVVPVLGALLVAGLILLTALAYGPRNESRVALGYTDGPTWSRTEARGYEQLSEIHDGDGLILNDPNDGSALAYAYFGLPVVFKSPLTPPYQPAAIGADRLLLLSRFDEIDDDPEIRAAAERLGVEWVVVGEGFTAVGQQRAAGLDELDEVDSLELEFRNRDVSVYRLAEPGDV
ncbi:DUF6541 family protein [Modestobacter sp. SYSU DS0290]